MREFKEYKNKIKNSIKEDNMSIAKSGAKALYYAYGGKILNGLKDDYLNIRFESRLQDFCFKEDELTDEEKKNFYENIDADNLNYLFELLDKARTSIFDIQAKVLSKIYLNLLKNNGLNEFDMVLLMNISTISLSDLMILNLAINQLKKEKNRYIYYLENSMHVKTLQRFLMLGAFELNHGAEKKEIEGRYPLSIKNNDFSMYIQEILNDLLE